MEAPAGRDRVFVCVLDGVGAGALPDAAAYGDEGADTLRHVLERPAWRCPISARLGLGEIIGLAAGTPRREATYGRLLARGAGKDTTTGHWEMMGCVLERAFPTYPHGFPREVIGPFEAAIGRRVLGNRPASGTEIIAELGEEHVRTGRPIVYTSADSVFQIACHEDVVPVEQLYGWCRDRARDPAGPARRRARHRTAVHRPTRALSGALPGGATSRWRRLDPPISTSCSAEGVPVVGVGKIGEIFAQRGVSVDDHTTDNAAGLAACLRHLSRLRCRAAVRQPGRFRHGLGPPQRRGRLRRRSAAGRRGGARLVAALRPQDVLMFCADHGVDPTTASTDHSREYSPLMALGLGGGRYDGGLADVGATAFRRLTGEEPPLAGTVDPVRAAAGAGGAPPLPAAAAVVFGSGLAALPGACRRRSRHPVRELRLAGLRRCPGTRTGWSRAACGPELRACCSCSAGRTPTRAGRREELNVPWTRWRPGACVVCC